MDIDLIMQGLEELRERGLGKLRDDDKKTLDIYWLEEIEEGDPYWWVDVINDDLCDLCKMNWIWTIMSRAEYENELREEDEEDVDWFIIIDEGGFSDGLMHDAVRQWLRDRGFEFDVRVIDSAGTQGEARMMTSITQAEAI